MSLFLVMAKYKEIGFDFEISTVPQGFYIKGSAHGMVIEEIVHTNHMPRYGGDDRIHDCELLVYIMNTMYETLKNNM